VDKNGLVLTNSHLVFGHQSISVTTGSREMVDAELVGVDPMLDLALLKIPVPAQGFPPAVLGDSRDVETGDEVVLIGNPRGQEKTATAGIISAINRTLTTAPFGLKQTLYQTDATFYHGNSGGPLVNRCAEVIGIASKLLDKEQGLGSAVPINVVKQVLPELLKNGSVTRPWVGVGGKFIRKELGKIIGLPLADGFLVETIDPESPAEKAGLNEGELPITIGTKEYLFGGDIIIGVNGQPFDGPDDLIKLTNSLRAGDKVRLSLFYQGQTREVEMLLTKRPIMLGE
jgi:S1-C subfamily serine protease